MRLFILLMCVSMGAWGATYYLDPAAETGGDGSESTPFDSWADVDAVLANDDTVLIKAGTSVAEIVAFNETGVTISTYGGPGGSAAVIEGYPPEVGTNLADFATIDAEATRNYALSMTDADNANISFIIAKGALRNNVRFTLTSTSSTTPRTLVLRDVIAEDSAQIGTGTPPVTRGTGVLVTTAGDEDSTGLISAVAVVDFRRVVSRNNGKHGMDFRGNVRGTVTQSITYENGTSEATATYGGHGFTAHPWRQDWASQAWADAGGGVFSKARQNALDTPSHVVVWSGAGTYGLVENTATPTTPAAGEWGFSGSTIYVRLLDDSDPSSSEIRYLRVPFGPLTWSQSRAYGTKVDAGGTEGHGFAFDSVSYRVYQLGTYSHDNEGAGQNAVIARDVHAIGNVFARNGTNGLRYQQWCVGCEAHNNTAIDNGDQGLYALNSTNYAFSNNVALNNGAVGMFATAESSGTSSNNISFGNATNLTNITGDEVDPQIDDNNRPISGSPLCAAGTSLGSKQDYGNRRFKTPPAIGAWECARGSPRESVSVRTSVNARTTVTAR